MQHGVKVTFTMDLKPEAADAVCGSVGESLAATRSFAGCRSVNAYRSEDFPNRVIIIEDWDSKAAYQKYAAWRNEQGVNEMLAQVLARPADVQYWPILLG